VRFFKILLLLLLLPPQVGFKLQIPQTPTNITGNQVSFKATNLSSVTQGTGILTATETSALQNDILSKNSSGVWVNKTPGVSGRTVSGTSDTINCAAGGDRGGVVTYTNAGLVTVTIGQAGTTCLSNFYVRLFGTGAGGIKVISTTSTLNGIAAGTGITYLQNTWVDVVSIDNANWTLTASRAIKAGTNITEVLNSDGSVTFNGAAGAVASVFGRTGAVVATAGDYTLDLIGNPAANASFTFPAANTLIFAGTAPASSSGAGTAASNIFTVTGPVGGATTGSATTAGVGSTQTITAGAGGSGAGGTNAIGGAGGVVQITTGAGGASSGTAANSNGGNFNITLGAAGTGGSGAAGVPGAVVIGPATSSTANITGVNKIVGGGGANGSIILQTSTSGNTGVISMQDVGGNTMFSCTTATTAANDQCTIGRKLNVVSSWLSSAAPTITGAGCGGSLATIASHNGTAVFTINVGTTPGSACTVTFPYTATNGWACFANDITTQSTNVSIQRKTSGTTTTCVITNFSDVTVATAFVANDIVEVHAFSY
jgi:hypothetical protein